MQVLQVAAVSKPAAVCWPAESKPFHIAMRKIQALVNICCFSRCNIIHFYFPGFINKSKYFIIRRPWNTVSVTGTKIRNFFSTAFFTGFHQPKFIFTASITPVSNGSAIGRPAWETFCNTRTHCKIFHITIFCRQRKNFTPCFYQYTFSIRADTGMLCKSGYCNIFWFE